jgi:hypothetical protein
VINDTTSKHPPTAGPPGTNLTVIKSPILALPYDII